jgi:hypothetical protein
MTKEEREYHATITQGAESTHTYNGRLFIVDHWEDRECWQWQCIDYDFTVKCAGRTKEEAIKKAHEGWDRIQQNKKETENNNYHTVIRDSKGKEIVVIFRDRDTDKVVSVFVPQDTTTIYYD